MHIFKSVDGKYTKYTFIHCTLNLSSHLDNIFFSYVVYLTVDYIMII